MTPSETDNLFRILRRLRDDGASLVFVSHKLEEVLDNICDRVTVLRDGENACESRSMEGLGRQDLVRLMIRTRRKRRRLAQTRGRTPSDGAGT